MTKDASYTSRHRDRYRLVVTALTGVATAGSLTATGWVAGHAAQAYAQQADPGTTQTDSGTTPAADRAAGAGRRHRARRAPARVVLRNRPTSTRVSTQYVTAPSSVGGGGSVSSGHSAPVSHNPPPAPSSGS